MPALTGATGATGADPTELAAVLAALAPTRAVATEILTTAGRRAVTELGADAVAWAAESAHDLAEVVRERYREPAPVEDIAYHLEGILVQLLLTLAGVDADADSVAAGGEARSESVRELVTIGAPFARMSDGIRMAHESAVRSLLAVATAQAASADTLIAIALAITSSMDGVLGSTVNHYLRETERFSLSAERARQEVIDLLLGGHHVDAHIVRDILGMSIEDHHLGLVVSGAASARVDRRTLRHAVDVVRTILHAPYVVVQENRDTLWVWASSHQPFDLNAGQLAAAVGDGMRIGLGAVHPMAEGFRRTHLEALAANRSGSPGAAGVSDYARDVLVVLLGADRERAAWFVEQELGELVRRSPRNHELLATLRCLFDSRMRVSVAADRLHIHRNTAIARLTVIEGVLGYPLAERALELQAALAVLDDLGEDSAD